jgi:predicted nucleic acid-binding protein
LEAKPTTEQQAESACVCSSIDRHRLAHFPRKQGQRNRILPDFLIGAHAQAQATRLLSRDRGFYRKLFPSLKLINPADS